MELVNTVEFLLTSKAYLAARDEILKPESLASIESEEMDLISKLCDIGLQEAEDEKDISACGQALRHIAQKSNPRLALVSILEQAESFMYSPKFNVVFGALRILMTRDQVKRAKCISWAFELLNKHLKLFHTFPENLNNALLEGEEALVLEQDPRIIALFQFYKDVCGLYEPLVADYVKYRNEVFAKPTEEDTRQAVSKKGKIFRANLIELLGSPLIYFDLSWSAPNPAASKLQNPSLKEKGSGEDVRRPKIKTEARLIAERIMGMLSEVNLDSSYSMKWIESQGKSYMNKNDEEETNAPVNIDEDEERIQTVSMANYLYLIYVENLSPSQLPLAFSPNYLFNNQLPLINALLGEKLQNYAVLQKGLLLAEKLISELKEALTHEFVTHGTYNEFLDKLIPLIGFCDSQPVRKLALIVLKSYFWVFDDSGRYMFLKRIWNTVDHDGLSGYMIGLLKDCIEGALNRTDHERLSSPFLGYSAVTMMTQVCSLPDGPTTDLLAISEQIVGSLNLLRYLLIRDGAKDESGILEVMKSVEPGLLNPLRSGLDLTKAHYELKLRELQDPGYGKSGSGQAAFETTLTVDGQEMTSDGIPAEEQIAAITERALPKLDFLKSLLIRVNECYSNVQK